MTEPTTFERELDFFESWDKLIERLTVAKVAMENHMSISEEDMEILRVIHKYWYNGEIVFVKTDMKGDNDGSVMQGSLFDDKKADPVNINTDGTEVEITDVN